MSPSRLDLGAVYVVTEGLHNSKKLKSKRKVYYHLGKMSKEYVVHENWCIISCSTIDPSTPTVLSSLKCLKLVQTIGSRSHLLIPIESERSRDVSDKLTSPWTWGIFSPPNPDGGPIFISY